MQMLSVYSFQLTAASAFMIRDELTKGKGSSFSRPIDGGGG